MTLATYWPIFTLTLLGDTPVASVLPAQATFDLAAMLPTREAIAHYVAFLLVSGFVAGCNTLLRKQKRKGKRSGPVMLFLLSMLNGVVGNLDQTVRQGRAATKKETP